MYRHPSSRRPVRIGVLAAVGAALFVLESLIPIPIPFFRIGLANVSTVIALDLFGLSEGLLVMGVRVIAGSALVGTLFSPAFVLSAGAGLASALAMGVVRRTTGRLFSIVGISLIGSVTHVAAQLFLVERLFVHSHAVGYLFPVLLLSALAGGLVVGWVAARAVRTLRLHQPGSIH